MARTSRHRDHTLVRRSQQGDRRAFLALLERYDTRLRELAYGLLVDARRVDNAMRLAYVKAWRDVVRIDPRDDAGPWLYRCVYNACIDELRREIRPAGAGAHTSAGAAGAPAAEPVSITDRETLAERTTAALRTLSPEQRVAVVLVDREGFGAEAAARIQGLGRSAVTARLATSRRILAEHVGVIDIPDPDSTTAEGPTAEEAAAGGTPIEDEELTPVDDAPVDEAPSGDAPAAGPAPLDEAPDEDEEIGLAPVDGELVEGERAEEPVAADGPVDGQRAEEPPPVDGERVEEPAPVDEAPQEGERVEEPAPVDEAPVDGERVEGEAAEEPVAADGPVDGERVEESAPVDEAPVDGERVEGEPVEQPPEGRSVDAGGGPVPDGDGAARRDAGVASEPEPDDGASRGDTGGAGEEEPDGRDGASTDRVTGAGRAVRGTRVP
ncbi:MAG: sigma factor [Acidimicrobiia bacterium]